MWNRWLTWEQEERVLERLPEVAKQIMYKLGPKCTLAGGFIRDVLADEQIKDVDLWVNEGTNLDSIEPSLIRPGSIKRIKRVYDIPTDTVPIQLIVAREDAFNTLICGFDFTVCCAAMRWNGERIVSKCRDVFDRDLLLKKLVVHPDFVYETTMQDHALRLWRKGYTPSIETSNWMLNNLYWTIPAEMYTPEAEAAMGIKAAPNAGGY